MFSPSRTQRSCRIDTVVYYILHIPASHAWSRNRGNRTRKEEQRIYAGSARSLLTSSGTRRAETPTGDQGSSSVSKQYITIVRNSPSSDVRERPQTATSRNILRCLSEKKPWTGRSTRLPERLRLVSGYMIRVMKHVKQKPLLLSTPKQGRRVEQTLMSKANHA